MKKIEILLKHSCLLLIGLLLISANRHPQSSAHPESGQMTLRLHSETVIVNLASPGTQYEKSRHGHFTRISFNKVTQLYIVTFHTYDRSKGERVKSVQRLSYHGDQLVLSGASETYSPEGLLLTEANWIEGKLDGPYRVYDPSGVVREERHYEQGLPVKTWLTHYEDGTKASEAEYPESYEIWEKTRRSAEQASVYAMAAQQNVPLTETWFNQDGTKQRERSGTAHISESGLLVQSMREDNYYDNGGRRIRQLTSDGHKVMDRRIVDADGKKFHTDVKWIGGTEILRRHYMLDSAKNND